MRRWFGTLAALACLAAAAPLRAQVSLRVLETDPASPVALDGWERFNLRIAYESDRPIRVRAAPFFGGKPVPGLTSGSDVYEAGKGEALFWISYTAPAKVDRVVVTAEDAATNRTVGAPAELAVMAAWSGRQPPASRPKADWVTRMDEENARRQKAAHDALMSRPTPRWLALLLPLLALCVPGYFLLQAYTLWSWRGGWRTAAALPLLPKAAVVIYTAVAFSRGSSLFPLVLLFTSPLACLYLLGLLIARSRRQAAATRTLTSER